MVRSLTLSLAVITSCLVGSAAVAQDGSPSDQQNVEMASYNQQYATGVQTPRAMAFGQAWGGAASNRDCSRFYHYPYVFYPQNFRGNEYYQSSNSMYYRYPPEMQIPVYNRHWHNYYPSPRRYHSGHHFILDVF